MKVQILPGRAIQDGAQLHKAGAILDLPDADADRKIERGCVERVAAPKKRAPKKTAAATAEESGGGGS